MSLRLYILQAREADDPMLEQERRCFVSATGLETERIHFQNLVERVPSVAEVRRFDALLVGGSGEFYVSKPVHAFFEPFGELLAEVAEQRLPLFASCFGYQALVAALGGEVIHDPENTEVGTFELELTDAATDDELFSQLPRRFHAQLGHKDRAARSPEGIPNLARSTKSPLQALRIPGRPAWATQFHPELDEATNRERFVRYLNDYTTKGVDAEAVLAGFRPSHEASGLLRAFIKLLAEL